VKSEGLLAYVFWHWPRPGVSAAEYAGRQRAFHAALAAERPSGFEGSFSSALSVPWANAGGEACEDWYLVRDFAALGSLNEGAVSASRAAPHDAAAAVAGGGTGGLYRLRFGTAPRAPGYAHWFSKPEGARYAEFLSDLEPRVGRAAGALWMRQLTMGPATEFCLHASEPVALPDAVRARVVALRPAWPPI